MTDLNMGFLSVLTEIHFPTGKTGPSPPQPFSMDLVAMIQNGTPVEAGFDMWLTLAEYKAASDIGTVDPIQFTSTFYHGAGAPGPSGPIAFDLGLSGLLHVPVLIIVNDAGSSPSPPFNNSASFVAHQLAPPKQAANAPNSPIGSVAFVIGSPNLSMQICGLGVTFGKHPIGAIGSLSNPVAVQLPEPPFILV